MCTYIFTDSCLHNNTKSTQVCASVDKKQVNNRLSMTHEQWCATFKSNIILLLLIGLGLLFRPRRSRSAAAYSRQTFRGHSVGRSVCLSVCPVHCGKTGDRIRMPFGSIGRTGPGMRQVVGFGDRSTVRGTLGGVFGARHCNRVRVRQCLNRRSCGLGWCVWWAEALLY